MRSQVLLGILCGCAAAPSDPLDLPDHPYTPEQLTAELDLEQLAEDVQIVVDSYSDFSPEWVIWAYESSLEFGSTDCPAMVETQTEDGVDMTYWDGVCTVPTGLDDPTFFNGPMTTWDWSHDGLDPSDQPFLGLHGLPWQSDITPVWNGRGIMGQTDIYGPEVDFNCTCLAHQATGTSDESDVWMRVLDGPSHSTLEETDGAWINDAVQVNLAVFARRLKFDGRRFATGKLEVSGLGSTYTTVGISYALRDDGDSGCTHQTDPSSLSIEARHGVTGSRVLLDWTLEEELCEACATVDESTACVSLAHLVQWEDAPW